MNTKISDVQREADIERKEIIKNLSLVSNEINIVKEDVENKNAILERKITIMETKLAKAPISTNYCQ